MLWLLAQRWLTALLGFGAGLAFGPKNELAVLFPAIMALGFSAQTVARGYNRNKLALLGTRIVIAYVFFTCGAIAVFTGLIGRIRI